jgi:putative phosphoesterase
VGAIVGLIADTHGFLDPRAVKALSGVDLILHAGDVGSPDVLTGLGHIAPVTAVAGNNDTHLAHLALPELAHISVENARIHVVHRLIDASPADDTNVVVYGHSHKPVIAERDARLYINPGAAGRVGFHREITIALLRVDGVSLAAEIMLLGPRVRKALPDKR